MNDKLQIYDIKCFVLNATLENFYFYFYFNFIYENNNALVIFRQTKFGP